MNRLDVSQAGRRLVCASVLLLAVGCRPPAPAPVAPAPTPTPPAVSTPRPSSPLPPTATSGLSVVPWPEAHAHVGETVVVEGVVLTTNRSNAGRVFLDFNDDPKAPDAFGLVIDPENLANFPFDPESRYLGRRVRVAGQIVLFQGHAEIHPRSPDDIQVLDEAGAGSGPLGPRSAQSFPEATLTVAQGRVKLWSAWPMEGRDPQRSGQADVSGPDQPTIALSVELASPSFGQVVQAADGTAYVGLQAGGMAAVDPSGSLRWRFDAPVGGPSPTPAIGPDGTVYLRAADGGIYALNADGSRRWTTDIGGNERKLGPALLVGADSYTYTASYSSTLAYRLQPGGFFQWALNVHARTLAGPAVGLDGAVYAGAEDGTLHAIDPDGLERWTARLDGPIVGPPAVDLQNRAYVLVGGAEPHLVALDASGQVRWRAPPCWQAGAPLTWPALGPGGRIQVGNCALGADGSLAWRIEVDAPSTPASVDASGTTYFAAGRRLYAVDGSGNVRWTFEADGPLNPPALGRGGQLLATSPGHLYVLGPSSG